MDATTQALLKRIPQVEKLLDSDQGMLMTEHYPREWVVAAVRAVLDELRSGLREGTVGAEQIHASPILKAALENLKAKNQPSLRRVINATGIVIHTNLGRAPLRPLGSTVAEGYSNLEFDLATGERGSRYAHVESLIAELTGAESAIIVNNNAAAVMLAINSMAQDSEVIISRGELVEIGGSFRVPDVITRSGASLVEVGATNKTHLSDYENAISDQTGALLKVHPSNFKMLGFTASVSREELVGLGRKKGLAVIEDLGSGTLVDLTQWGLPREDTVPEVIEAGVDLVTFSGDKLLGGPQAGIVCGRAELVDAMRSNPLLRALRIDKLSLGALETTLRIYLKGPEHAARQVPALRMLTQSEEALAKRAARLAEKLSELAGVTSTATADHSYTGGGALPDEKIPTRVVELSVEGHSPNALAGALRAASVPVVGRIRDGRFCLDMRTVGSDDLDEIVAMVEEVHA